MDLLTDCVERLDRLRHPSDLCFARGGDAVIAADLAGEPPRPARAIRAASGASRSTARPQALTDGPGSDIAPRPSPVDDRLAFLSDRSLRGKRSVFLLENGRCPAARRDPRHDRGSALDQRRRGADRARRRSRPRCRRHRRRRAALVGRRSRIPPSPIRRQARRRLYRIDAGDGATTEVGPADLTVWEFDLLGDGRRWRWSPPIPASAAGITRGSPVSISRAGPPRSSMNRPGSCRARRRSRRAARRLPRRLVQRSRPRRRRDPDSRSRHRARHEPRRRQALQRDRPSVARCGEPVVRRLASPRLDLRRHPPRRHDSNGSSATTR